MSSLPIFLAVSDQAVVGVATIVLMTGVLITAILHYKVDDFVKFWATVGTVIGLALGTVGTFFFTKDKVEQTQTKLEQTKNALVASQQEKLQAAERLTKI